MTHKDMTALVSAYDGANELHEVIKMLYGVDYGVEIGKGIIGKLDGLVRIICNNSPLYDPKANVGEDEFWKILLSDASAEERAKALLGKL